MPVSAPYAIGPYETLEQRREVALALRTFRLTHCLTFEELLLKAKAAGVRVSIYTLCSFCQPDPVRLDHYLSRLTPRTVAKINNLLEKLNA